MDASANSSLESDTDSPALTEDVEYNEYSGMVGYLTDWIASLSRDDLLSVSILLWHVLVGILGLKVTYAAETIGNLLGRSDRTVRDWRTTFNFNNGSFPDTLQGKYQRTGVVWQSEELNKKARRYVRENAVTKGKPNLTATSFCQWVNECLLVVEPLEPGYPQRITVETARKCLLALGFLLWSTKKEHIWMAMRGTMLFDIEKKFLRQLCALGFLNQSNAPTEEAAASLPTDLHCPSDDRVAKTVVFFHDESTFQANDDQVKYWGSKDMVFLQPKSKGSGLMVSDFIDEHHSFLQLSDEEYERAKTVSPGIQKYARTILENGENKEGYWTSEKFYATD